MDLLFSILCLTIAWLRRLSLRLLLVLFFPWRKGVAKTVLLIRDDQLGDFLLSLGTLRALSEFYHAQGFRVVFVHSPKIQEAVAGCPWFDECETLPLGQGLLQQLQWYRGLARRGASVTVKLPAVFGSSSVSSIAAVCACARETVALWPYWPLKTLGEKMNAHRNRRNCGLRRRLFDICFSKKRQCQLIQAWSYEPFRPWFRLAGEYRPWESIGDTEARLVEFCTGEKYHPTIVAPEWLLGEQPQVQGKYYIVVPGCGDPARRWPIENFAKVIDEISQMAPELRCVITGVASEKELGEQLNASAQCVNLCGKSNLRQLTALVASAEFVLCNDTATSHLAAAFERKSFVLLGGGHYGIYHPNPVDKRCEVFAQGDFPCLHCVWLCHRMTAEGKYPCVSEIPVADVVSAIRAFWKRYVPQDDRL